MTRLLGLLACILLLAAVSRIALAQDETNTSQVRYIEELKQRNAYHGPGCDGIGISVPANVDMLGDVTSRWAAGHSACIPDLRFMMSCVGEVTGADRVIGCTLRIAEGQNAGTIACEQFTLITPTTRFTPDVMLSDVLAEASEGGSRSCSDPQDLIADGTIAAAFIVPTSESVGDLAVMIDVDGAEVPAFLVPAAQVNVEPSPEP